MYLLYGAAYFNNRQEQELEQSDLERNFPLPLIKLNNINSSTANTSIKRTDIQVCQCHQCHHSKFFQKVSKSTILSYIYLLLQYNPIDEFNTIIVGSDNV